LLSGGLKREYRGIMTPSYKLDGKVIYERLLVLDMTLNMERSKIDQIQKTRHAGKVLKQGALYLAELINKNILN
jgi:hypothetical protein